MEQKRGSIFVKSQSSSGNRPETFAIRVTGYNTQKTPNTVTGFRLDNDEEVSVFLREIEQKSNGRHKRSEISDFAAPRKDRQHPGTALGGTLLATEAFQSEKGVFGARWIQSLSHAPGEAEVFIVNAHVSPVKYSKGSSPKPYSLMTYLHDGNFPAVSEEMANALRLVDPFTVDNTEQLKEAISQMLQDDIGVGIRLSSAEAGFDALYVRHNKENAIDTSIDAFFSSKLSAEIEEMINKGELKCEIIPYSNLFGGPSTVKSMEESPVIRSRVARYNDVKESGGREYPVSLFRPTIVAARLSAPDEVTGKRSAYFSHFEPLNTRYPVEGLVTALAYASTEIMSPLPPRPASMGQAPEATPKPAPSGQQQETGAASSSGSPVDAQDSGFGDGASFDAGMPPTDDDMMAAAAKIGSTSEESAPAPAPAVLSADEAPPARRAYNRSRATA